MEYNTQHMKPFCLPLRHAPCFIFYTPHKLFTHQASHMYSDSEQCDPLTKFKR